LRLAEEHGDVMELTADVARKFIDKMVVHEAVKIEDTTTKTTKGTFKKKKVQKVQVFINCIGEFNPV
jgi:hypothetical protein